MKFLTSCIVLFSVLNLSLGLSDIFKSHLWDKFKKSHGKQYFSDEHEDFRFNIFKKNLDLIEKHNEEFSMGMHSYTLGVNSFADWSFEEFKKIMFGTKRNMTADKSASSGTFFKLPSYVKAADSVDWRELGAVTPVKNQGQ